VAAAPGGPLRGLGSAELERFERGRAAFEAARDVSAGLGPLFNDSACNRCHNKRGVGGAGIQVAVSVGRLDGEVFDPLLAQGGPTLATSSVTLEAAARAAVPGCKLPRYGEDVPAQANVVARRRTTPLFGLGLVDATPDDTFLELARRQPPAIRGRAPLVPNPTKGGRSVGKFGWKARSPTLHQFSGLALANELGVTNPEFPTEHAPLGDASLLAGCDLVPGLEDDGQAVTRLTDFALLLAPIAPLEQSPSARAGDALFTRLGCDGCHVRRITSGPSPIAALSRKEYAPFSDFLLHDMGSLGDGIGGEGDAAPREMRTAPLWGGHLAGSARLLHDGRARSFGEAIERHDGQGALARDAFAALPSAQRLELVAFLETL
jgi:CxxC motif-containing protein (DUF1111 family)